MKPGYSVFFPLSFFFFKFYLWLPPWQFDEPPSALQTLGREQLDTCTKNNQC